MFSLSVSLFVPLLQLFIYFFFFARSQRVRLAGDNGLTAAGELVTASALFSRRRIDATREQRITENHSTNDEGEEEDKALKTYDPKRPPRRILREQSESNNELAMNQTIN